MTIKSLIFNTKFSNNNNNTNPSFFLQKNLYNIDAFSVKDFIGVNTFYNIDSRNNRLSFVETDSNTTIRNVVLDVGNYTLSFFMTALQNAMNVSAGSGTYTVSNDALTNRISISSTTAFSIVSSNYNCYYEIGFDLSTGYSTTQTASSTYDFSSVKCINVCSSSLGVSNSMLVNKSLNVICSIPVSVGYLGVISFTNNPVFIEAQVGEINSFDFFLYDELFRQLTVDKPWSMTLYFQEE